MAEMNRPSFGSRLGRALANCLTLVVLLATLGIGAAFATVYLNPDVFFNPFPPPTLPPVLDLPTAAPTATSTNTAVVTVTATLEPTATATSTPVPPTATPTPVGLTATPTPTSVPFGLQAGSIAATTSWFRGCDWMGVGGHVLEVDNSPLTGYVIQLGGELAGDSKNMEALSGSASELLGTSGYLFELADHPIASVNTLWLQLVDGSGNPLSEKVYLTTYDTCTKNLLLANWRRLP